METSLVETSINKKLEKTKQNIQRQVVEKLFAYGSWI